MELNYTRMLLQSFFDADHRAIEPFTLGVVDLTRVPVLRVKLSGEGGYNGSNGNPTVTRSGPGCRI